MSDLIDREKALDKIWEARRSQQMLDNTQVADLVMHGLYIAESIIEELPSVRPKIIRCKDCKWRENQDGATMWLPCRAIVTPSDFYCGSAELRGDSE